MSERKIRVVLGKVGLDGHDRGVKVVARALRDAGMEVIYTGLHLTPEEVVAAAVQEDANFLGISILSGAHMTIFPRILQLMRERDADDIVLFGGGVILPKDARALRELGVASIFGPEATAEEMVNWVRDMFQKELSVPAEVE